MLNGTVLTLNDVNVSAKPDEHSANYSKGVITLALKAGSRLFEISDGKAKIMTKKANYLVSTQFDIDSNNHSVLE